MRRIDEITLVAIASFASVLTLVDHELLGHGIACVLAGGHFIQLTSVNETWNGDVGPVATRAITLAGIASNIFWGVVALAILRAAPQADTRTRYFLWFFGHMTIFMGSGYLLASSLFGFGDLAAAIRGLPDEMVWRIVAAAIGLAIYRFALLSAARTLEIWTGSGDRSRRLRALALIPYLVSGVAVTLSGFVNPPGASAGFWWSVGPILGAGWGFAYLQIVLMRSNGSGTGIDVPRSRTWIAAGGIAVLTLFMVLAPGIPR